MTNFLKKHLWDKTGAFKLTILTSPLFIGGLGIKILASFFFASDYLGKLFIPFLKFYTLSGFNSPYEHFYSLGMTDMFPYPKMMLYIVSLPGLLFKPFLNPDIFLVTHFELFLYRLPLILADIVILVVLARWLKGKEKQVLIFYWLSPILLYINYFHGQFDVIPIALVFVFLYFLFKEKWSFAYIALGVAIATKFHLIILVPFTVVYIWRKKKNIQEIAIFLAILGALFVGINNIDLFSTGFKELVFNNREQFKIFDLRLLLGANTIIYLIPLAYIALFFHSLTFRFFNRDVFVMFLGFSFGILTLLIPPMQGWYYWIIPFFIYFYLKNVSSSKFVFWMLTVGYFLYFLVIPTSDFFHIFQYTNASIGSMPNVYGMLQSHNMDARLFSNIVFTFLQATLFVNVMWIYRRGVEESKKNKLYNMPYLVGIAGDSGSGKSVFAGLLANVFGEKNIAIVAGDDMHKWERGNDMWQKYTHLDPGANELHGNLEHALMLKSGRDIYRRRYDHNTGTFTFPNKLESKKVVVFEGLHSFYLTQMRKALDLKIFIMPDEQLRTHWKLCRDMKDRGYTKKKVLENLQKREGDANKFIKTQEEYADIIISLRSKNDISEKLGEHIIVDMFLELKCNNDVNVEAFVQALSPFVTVDHFFSEQAQMIRVSGKISKDDVEKVSYIFEPELCEVVVTKPDWSANYNGIIELFVSYYILNSLKFNKYE